MKKVISILVIAVMLLAGLFVLTGCGNNETTTGGSSSSGKSNDSSNWMADFEMSNLKVPEGATVEKGPSYSTTDKQIKRDTEFTDAEIDAFAQSVLENCEGAYKSKYNADTDEYEKVTLQNVSEAKGDDEFGWKYEKDGKTYSIRINFSVNNMIRFERY